MKVIQVLFFLTFIFGVFVYDNYSSIKNDDGNTIYDLEFPIKDSSSLGPEVLYEWANFESRVFDFTNNSNSLEKSKNRINGREVAWRIFCIYVGFVGVFISVFLNLKKKSDRIANLLIGMFLFQYAVFIINMGGVLTNDYSFSYNLNLFSLFLCGPLVYFYCKRVLVAYKFTLLDLLHLMPMCVLLFLYQLEDREKIVTILYAKYSYIRLFSILIYMILVMQLFVEFYKKRIIRAKKLNNWVRNIIILYAMYVTNYVVYDVVAIQLAVKNDFIVFSQIIFAIVLILYVSYIAYTQPEIYEKVINVKRRVKKGEDKYINSGLTKELSIELKEKLLILLNEEKAYKQNDINLQKLSELLGTTRHNTSQIINEHFNLNFFELINQYRIQEAKILLIDHRFKNGNIIDVAYEVGFNNKVTFNKSFKKYNKITPSEYIKF
ncbi:helix-turn-helix domain-containing protein [Aquimarina aquimarini]|uniref:helix-turn-helix domain-containing protein n=1 Tax=Aquimarina aquimarini TaxID=1191734 RepID=UPI000D55338D|nr:response regulator transcription factor [Aquimarina aquimarini]